jgi:hypothetical protein
MVLGFFTIVALIVAAIQFLSYTKAMVAEAGADRDAAVAKVARWTTRLELENGAHFSALAESEARGERWKQAFYGLMTAQLIENIKFVEGQCGGTFG